MLYLWIVLKISLWISKTHLSGLQAELPCCGHWPDAVDQCFLLPHRDFHIIQLALLSADKTAVLHSLIEVIKSTHGIYAVGVSVRLHLHPVFFMERILWALVLSQYALFSKKAILFSGARKSPASLIHIVSTRAESTLFVDEMVDCRMGLILKNSMLEHWSSKPRFKALPVLGKS